jgi:hypothetical protein
LSCFGGDPEEKLERAATIRGCGAAGSAPAWTELKQKRKKERKEKKKKKKKS